MLCSQVPDTKWFSDKSTLDSTSVSGNLLLRKLLSYWIHWWQYSFDKYNISHLCMWYLQVFTVFFPYFSRTDYQPAHSWGDDEDPFGRLISLLLKMFRSTLSVASSQVVAMPKFCMRTSMQTFFACMESQSTRRNEAVMMKMLKNKNYRYGVYLH